MNAGKPIAASVATLIAAATLSTARVDAALRYKVNSMHVVYAKAETASALELSPNWSGYAVTGRPGTQVSYTRVRAMWTEPTVRCVPGDAGASSAAWVGLGGYQRSGLSADGLSARKVEQVGTDANCNASGAATYYAWFAVAPYPATAIKGSVLPGDTITGSVNILPRLAELQIEDRTRHWAFTTKISWPSPDTTSAEWIVEAPVACARFSCGEAGLANFGSVMFHEVAATGNSSFGTLTKPDWTATPIRLVPTARSFSSLDSAEQGSPADTPPAATSVSADVTRSPAGASPGTVSDSGSTFTVTWAPVARSR